MGEIDRLYRETRAQCKRLQKENERLRTQVDDLAAGTAKLLMTGDPRHAEQAMARYGETKREAQDPR
jgi:ABC-type transport system involved in cytochrome bd biosynthesis fused ATPase/permease subunit